MNMLRPLSAVLVSATLITQASAATIPAPIFRLGFDEANGLTVIDAAVKGGDSTLINGAERVTDIPQTGITNHKSVSLDGNQQYVSAPHIGFDNRSFTIAGWLKTTDMTATQTFLSQGDPARSSKNLTLKLSPQGALTFSFLNDDTKTADGVFTANTWHHTAFTFDAKTKQRRIFVDGAMQANGTASGVFLGVTGLTDIGRMNVQPFGSEFWQGMLDEISVFDQALSVDQIALLATKSADTQQVWQASSASMSFSSSSVKPSVVPFAPKLSLSDRIRMRIKMTKKAPVVRSSSASSVSSLSSPSSYSSLSSVSSLSSQSASSVAVAPEEGPLYRVISLQLHLRKDSRATAVNIRTLMPHDPLIVLQMLKNGWAKVKTLDGVHGYVNASFIEKVE